MTSEPTAAPPDCPPLLTQPGDLTDYPDGEPEGWCWVCTIFWVLAGLFIGSVVMFAGNLLVDLARRMAP